MEKGMEKFTLAQAAEWCKGELKGDTALTGVSTDSRQIPLGALFVAIDGKRLDGHNFIYDAIRSGAAAVMSHRVNEEYSVPAVYVDDTQEALLDLAAGYRGTCKSKVIGVTGSVGKTTTKELMYSVLNQGFRALKTEGNFNNKIGVPLTLMRMERDTEVMVTEMGMNHFGELSRISRAARPDIALITNIGLSHIEYLGSKEGILQAKLEVLEGLKKDGCAVFCGDDPMLWDKRGKVGRKVYTYGIKNTLCDLTAHLHNDGTFGILNNGLPVKTLPKGESFQAGLNIPGEHNVLNALAAATVGLLLGESPEAIAEGLALYKTDGMRQNIYKREGFTIYDDCYNSSPDAAEAVLKVLGSMKECGRRFAVMGTMLELGDFSEECHRSVGYAVAENADVLYTCGKDARFIAAGARERGMKAVHEFDTHDELAAALRHDAVSGDALLFKGSRGSKMERALALFFGEDV